MKKKIYSVLVTPLIVFIASFLLLGCVYKNYAGRYWVGKTSPSFISHPASAETNDKIEEVVRSIANDFGFIEDRRLSWMEQNVITFGGKRKEIKTKYDNLNGSDSAITLLIKKSHQPEVGIKDYSHTYETDFVRALKNELESRLSKVVDMKGVEFIRHWDLMD